MRNEETGTEHEPCGNCGKPVNTIPGMDRMVKVTEFTTTDYTWTYFCGEQCLSEHFGGESDD